MTEDPPRTEPTGWAVLRRLDRLEQAIGEQFAAVAARLDDTAWQSYSRDFLDGQHRHTDQRLTALETSTTTTAAARTRRSSQLLAAFLVQSLATASAVAVAILTAHH